MAAPLTALLPLLSLTALSAAQSAQPAPQRRFEYKYSFKGPHLVRPDGTVPFWLHTGNAIPSSDQIRITTSLKSQKGSVWTKNKSTFEFWEVEVTFRVTGRGRVGADGLALWFTEQQGLQGSVFGAADQWSGVGIFLDSFDNDGKKNNPAVVIVANNGKLLYDHQNDGSNQALASCQRDFRNKPYPVRVRITYYQKTLTLSMSNGFSADAADVELCARLEELPLPPRGYFGVSAATGALADDHDVLSFLTFQLVEPGRETLIPDTEIPQEDKEKYQEELENFQQELNKKKEEFRKEHPDVQGEEAAEDAAELQLRQILEAQSRVATTTKELRGKLDDVIAVCERGWQLFQQETQNLARTQEELLRQMKAISSSLPSSSSSAQALQELREHFLLIQREIQHLKQQNSAVTAQPSCPDCPALPPCLSTSNFLLFLALQSAALLAYLLYRNQQEAAAKKFF